ncbi:MAG: VOC family protein [Mycetocola sp.]
MQWDRMEYVGIVVDDLEEGVRRFSELFGLDFEILDMADLVVEVHDGVTPDSAAPQSGMRVALDSTGNFELVEVTGAPEGIRNIHVRVPDIDEAIADLSAKGLRLVRGFTIGGMREAIFDGDDFYQVRICLLEYEGPSLAQAMLLGART